MADVDIVVAPVGVGAAAVVWTVEDVTKVINMAVNSVNFIEKFTPLSDRTKSIITTVEGVVQSPWFIQAVVTLETLVATGSFTQQQIAAEFLKIVLAQAK